MENQSFSQESSPFLRSLSSDGDEVDLVRLLLPVWRRKWSLLSLALIVMMLAALVALNITPVYRAVSTLLIEQRSAQVVSIEELYGLEGAGSEYLFTQFELLKSRDLAERVVMELRLVDHPEFDPRQQKKPFFDIHGILATLDPRRFLPLTMPQDLTVKTPEDTQLFDAVVNRFMAATAVTPVLKTQLVKISVQLADPQVAAAAANALATAYITSQLEAKLNMSQTATSWMNEQLSELKASLQLSERRLQTFRDQEDLLDLEGVTSVSADELAGTGERLIDARRTRSEIESQYRQIASLKGASWEQFVAAPAILSDPLVQQFRTGEAAARRKVEEFSRLYGPKYPKMIAAQAELDTATASLKAQVDQVVASIEKEYQLAMANEQSLKSSFDKNRGEIQDITRKEFRLRELQREVDTNRQLYETFMTRLKETSATQNFDALNARVVEKAVTPKVPVKPNKARIVMISGILALLGGVGVVLLSVMLSNSFKSVEDVETNLDLPVLGILPLVKSEKTDQLHKAFHLDHDKSFSESIRTLRTSLVLSSVDKPHRVVLVTSSVPGEGKSTTASNLAFSLGHMHKVLLIDCDLRRPSQRKSFDLPVGTPGVANYIAHTASVEECIRNLEPNVDLLTAGTVPPNPQELLSSLRFSELIDLLKERYAYIIIDSPPALAVSDSALLATLADAVIYVIKSNATAIPLAQKGVGHLLQKNAPVIGVVLNRVDIKKADKYGYSYGGYYDYYGYNRDQKA